MLLIWAAIGASGLFLAVVASRRAVEHAGALAAATGIPPFIVGLTLLAIGTDLPEVANSIIASVSGYGDLNVGDSVGSAATQVTLVLGLVPFLGGAFDLGRLRVAAVGTLTVLALALGAVLVSDGFLSRIDGIAMLTAWVVATAYLWRTTPGVAEPTLPLPMGTRLQHGLLTLLGLVGVAVGATATVTAFVRLAETLGLPVYLVSFFGVALGTSLPELVVVLTALRKGQGDIAIGDAFGASLLDSTLSIGIGPTVAPIAVTAGLALRGSLVTAAVILLVTLTFWRTPRHTRWTGALLLVLYAAFFPLLLA